MYRVDEYVSLSVNGTQVGLTCKAQPGSHGAAMPLSMCLNCN